MQSEVYRSVMGKWTRSILGYPFRDLVKKGKRQDDNKMSWVEWNFKDGKDLSIEEALRT